MAEEAKVTESTDMKFTDEELQSLQDLQNNYQEKSSFFSKSILETPLLDADYVFSLGLTLLVIVLVL